MNEQTEKPKVEGYVSLNVDGTIVGLKFARPAILMFAKSMEKNGEFYYTSADGQPVITTEGCAKFIECGYKNNCLIKEVEPLFKYEFFYNWCEQAVNDKEKMDQIAKVLECYAETLYAKKIEEEGKKIADAKADDEKKNSTGMILTQSLSTKEVTEEVS